MEITKERNNVWKVNHPTIGPLPLLANALQHTNPSSVSNTTPPPLLGQHTHEILREFANLPEKEIEFLDNNGSVFCSRKDTKIPLGDNSDD